MKKIWIVIPVIIWGLFSGPALAAQSSQWKVDPAHTQIHFNIQHIFALINGQFTDFNGKLVFDPENPENGHFDFSVEVDSINTLNNKRDTHLRSREFFDESRYPLLRFTSSKITHLSDNKYKLDGLMTIKDVKKPVSMIFYFDGPKAHPFEKNSVVAGFRTKFSLNRLDYHVGDGRFFKMGVVGDTVNVSISIEALK